MKCNVEMGSGGMIDVPSSGIQKLIGGTHVETHTQRGR
jgi:hypothetical protein